MHKGDRKGEKKLKLRGNKGKREIEIVRDYLFE